MVAAAPAAVAAAAEEREDSALALVEANGSLDRGSTYTPEDLEAVEVSPHSFWRGACSGYNNNKLHMNSS